MKKHNGLSFFMPKVILLLGCVFLVGCSEKSDSTTDLVQDDPLAIAPAKVTTSRNDQDQNGIRDFTQDLFSKWENFNTDEKWTSNVASKLQAIVDNYNTPNEAEAVKEYWESVVCLMRVSSDPDGDLSYIRLLTLSNSASREAYKVATERSEIGMFEVQVGDELCA